MLQNAISYLEELVGRGGPSENGYRELVQTFDTIFRLEFAVQNGVSNRVHRSHELDTFFKKHRDIFRTTSSMQGFAYSKPHGYSGDFEIIERIYTICTSHKHNIINWDTFFHSGSASNAVRNRAKLLSSLVEEVQPRELLSVGCGPALDIVGASKIFQNSPNVSLLDNDESAIARAKINSALADEIFESVSYHHKNALRFRSEKSFDLIWSSGLFDYLNDKTAVFLLSRLRAMLSPSGSVAIGNFSHDNPSRSYMEIVGEWFLIHRSKEDLLRLAEAAGFKNANIRLAADETGLNIFIIARNS